MATEVTRSKGDSRDEMAWNDVSRRRVLNDWSDAGSTLYSFYWWLTALSSHYFLISMRCLPMLFVIFLLVHTQSGKRHIPRQFIRRTTITLCQYDVELMTTMSLLAFDNRKRKVADLAGKKNSKMTNSQKHEFCQSIDGYYNVNSVQHFLAVKKMLYQFLWVSFVARMLHWFYCLPYGWILLF